MKKISADIMILFISMFLLFSPAGHAQSSKGGFTSSKVCGNCHKDIYEAWKKSMHSQAVSDPIFYPIFLETSQQTGGKSEPICLSCHAPTIRLTKDVKLKEPLTSEGVTCDFCHSVQAVKVGAPDPFTLDVGKTKRGPLTAGKSPFHETAHSDLFEKADLCAGCHQLVNSRGVVVLGTYQEWQKSPQAREGKVCQTCHMPQVGGYPSHEASGGHSAERVKSSVTVKVGEVKRVEDKIQAIVQLENTGSAHKIPTGIPSRKLVLRLEAFAAGVPIYSEERVFQKVLLNSKGEIITKDSDLFLNAYQLKSDNRLEPRKPRSEYFSFYAPKGKPVEITTKVYYLYQPKLIQETEMKIEISNEKATVPEK